MCAPLETIDQAIRYIEARLREELTVAQVAQAAGYSLFHFIRTFNRVAWQTPYDYLIRRRLSEAAGELAHSPRRIADIAQDYCFENQESFSRAFKRMFAVQPSRWREQPGDIALLTPPRTLADLRYLNRADFVLPGLLDWEGLPLAGLMTPLTGDEDERAAQRCGCLADLERLAGAGCVGDRVAVTSYLDAARTQAYFFAGCDRRGLGIIPPPWVTLDLPAGRYLRMPAAVEDRRAAWNFLYAVWLPGNGRIPRAAIEIEITTTGENSLYLPLAEPGGGA